jgi:hypothetical protein
MNEISLDAMAARHGAAVPSGRVVVRLPIVFEFVSA